MSGTKNDVVQKLAEHFPDEKKALIAFFDDAEQAMIEKLSLRTDPTKQIPTYKQWASVTYQQKLDAFFHDAQLKKFLCSLLGYLGTEPETTVATDALFACLSYFIFGGHYPKKGGQLFADTLKDVVVSHGGMVLTNTKVDEILVKDAHVNGVRAGETTYLSSIVVANVNAKTLFLNLIPKGVLDARFISAINDLKMSCSEAVVHLGVDLDLSHFSSIVHVNKQENKCSFFVNSNVDRTMAPTGKASISVGVDATYKDVAHLNAQAYEKYKDNLVEQAITKLVTVISEIRDHIIVKNVVTPKTFEQFTSMPEGAVYAFDQSAGSKRPYFKTPIKGLYLASASTLPGAGVEAVVGSGLICVRDIVGGVKVSNNSNLIQLPSPSLKSTVSVEEAIKNRQSIRRFEATPLTIADISQLLWAAQGITHGESFRAAPSAGALYPLEIYLVTKNVTDIPTGVYKYNLQKHALEKHMDRDVTEKLCFQNCVKRAAANIVVCGVYERIAKKYGAGAEKYTHMEVGCVAENVALQALSCGVGTVFVAGFDADDVKKVLELPENEQPLCLLPLGKVR